MPARSPTTPSALQSFESPLDRASDTGKRQDREVAHYIVSMSAELGLLARRQHFDTLAYILELARLEADNLRNR